MNLPEHPLPTIHLNGSSPDSLFKDYMALYEAVKEAITALEQIDFHARDYYVQEDRDAFEDAKFARHVIFNNLIEARNYALNHAAHIQKSIKE